MTTRTPPGNITHTELLNAIESFLQEHSLMSQTSERLRTAMVASHQVTTAIGAGEFTTSILRPWVTALPIRYQGVLIAAVRGCDSVPKDSSAKPVVRALRYAFMVPCDEREMDYPGAFMSRQLTWDECLGLLKDWDHYPIHFLQHLMHGVEVIGYKHPEFNIRHPFNRLYLAMCRKLHVNPESDIQLRERLTEDRIEQQLREIKEG